ncbi:hypothetical protein HU200_011044 [Digitaria exilis]|uniref:Uncharacterized protein n=1 Tax=Digitaria exilis TaxID=1010633 RepID=A0A835KR22_9POAL|nr:hypothetical protein HU200_011044 [Digitaria exilis]
MPESLMSQIDAAIAPPSTPAPAPSSTPPPPPPLPPRSRRRSPRPRARARGAQLPLRPATTRRSRTRHTVRRAGRPDAAVRSLRVALASCPPEKTAAVAKVRSMLAIASAQLHKQQHQAQQRRK